MEGTVRASGVQMSWLAPLARHDSEMRPLCMTVRGVEDILACSGTLRLTPLSTPNGRTQCIIDVSVLRGDYPHAPEHTYHLSMYTKSGEGCLGVSKPQWRPSSVQNMFCSVGFEHSSRRMLWADYLCICKLLCFVNIRAFYVADCQGFPSESCLPCHAGYGTMLLVINAMSATKNNVDKCPARWCWCYPWRFYDKSAAVALQRAAWTSS